MGVKMCHCLQTFLTWFAVVWRIHHPTGTAFCYEVSTEQYFYLFLNVTSETMWYAVLFCKCWRCFLLLYHPPSSEVCHNGYDSFLLPFVIGDLFNLGTESVICAILKGLMDHILLHGSYFARNGRCNVVFCQFWCVSVVLSLLLFWTADSLVFVSLGLCGPSPEQEYFSGIMFKKY